MKIKPSLFALLLFVSIGSTIAQPLVVRGPYLNLATSSSIVVRWRTDTISDTKIWYGSTLDTALMVSIVDLSSVTDHEINVTGLTADTKYFYAIGSTSNFFAGADSGHYFKTSPQIGTKQPIRIWVTGDFGEGNTNQAAVRDAFIEYTGDGHADAWLWLGDNAYDDGRDDDYQTGAFDMYPTIFPHTVAWPALGNHDYGSTHPFIPLGNQPYLDMFTLPTAGEAGGTPSGDEGYYSYDIGNVHFICINSENYTFSAFPSVEVTHDATMLTWIENDLANNTNTDWLIAYVHATPYCDGTHSENYSGPDIIAELDGIVMRSFRDNILPILENYGVDLVLAGHSHDYERSYLTYGNYGVGGPYPPDSTIVDGGTGRLSDGTPYQKFMTGPNANKGGVFCVVGCSAKTGSFAGDGPLNHELMIFDDYRLGSMVIDIDNDQLDAYFIDTSGTAWDNFTIIKIGLSSNTAPNAVDDIVSTDSATTVLIDVQVNDSDPEGNPLTTTIVSGPANGSATVMGTSIEYTPNAGFTGMDTIVYSICDNGTPPLCDIATIIITVNAGVINILDPSHQSATLSVTPNPFTSAVTLEYTLSKSQDIKLEIYDLGGKLLYSFVDEKQSAGTYKYTIDAEQTGLVVGTYLVRFKTEGSSKVQKIIRL